MMKCLLTTSALCLAITLSATSAAAQKSQRPPQAQADDSVSAFDAAPSNPDPAYSAQSPCDAAYSDQSWAAAFEACSAEARQGSARAQRNLGEMYQIGRGVPQSDQEAVRYYRLAADQGDATAQNNLGAMYLDGRGVPQSDQEAVRYYRLAADQGDATAQNYLGRMYQIGRGVPQSDQEAVGYYRPAATQGNAFAQYNIGVMYENGRGVPQSYTEAVRYYRLAAAQGNAIAQKDLGFMYQNGRGVPQSDQEAVRYYRLAAAQGNSEAQSLLNQIINAPQLAAAEARRPRGYAVVCSGTTNSQLNLHFVDCSNPESVKNGFRWAYNLLQAQPNSAADPGNAISTCFDFWMRYSDLPPALATDWLVIDNSLLICNLALSRVQGPSVEQAASRRR